MQKLVFSYISVWGWVIDLYVHGLFDGPNDTMCLPAYNGEAVHTHRMSHGLGMLIDGGEGFEVFTSYPQRSSHSA